MTEDRIARDMWSAAVRAITTRARELGTVITVAFIVLIIVSAITVVAADRGKISQHAHPSWALLWHSAHDERYYIDTATIHTDGGGTHAVLFQTGPIQWGGGLRGVDPRQIVQREEATYHCNQHSVEGTSVTTVETIPGRYEYSTYPVVIFVGTAQDHGPREAMWAYLCDRHPAAPTTLPAPARK
ncbi:MAG: hypothetical protein ACR2MQ_16355 [Gemmatimonadaceae bacterium]